jgi:hypothetical protein
VNTFLPLESFTESAKCLDNQRLTKQVFEAKEIFYTITGKSEGWKNHPCCVQWRGHGGFLVSYGKAIAEEALSRGIQVQEYVEFFKNEVSKSWMGIAPWWLGDDRFHSSHRSKLLFKGRYDSVCAAIKTKLKIKKINDWLEANGYPYKNKLDQMHVKKLEHFCSENGITIGQNWYLKFGWGEKDDLPYFWPSKAVDKVKIPVSIENETLTAN